MKPTVQHTTMSKVFDENGWDIKNNNMIANRVEHNTGLFGASFCNLFDYTLYQPDDKTTLTELLSKVNYAVKAIDTDNEPILLIIDNDLR